MSKTPESEGSPVTEQDENRLIAERRAKLDALRASGNAYPNDFRKNVTSAELHARFDEATDAELEANGDVLAVAGRMMAKRVMGKIAFVRLQDRGGDIQLVIQRERLPEGVFQEFRLGRGRHRCRHRRIFRTQKGSFRRWIRCGCWPSCVRCRRNGTA
jgi:lysyl-tRNA synthetase class 2